MQSPQTDEESEQVRELFLRIKTKKMTDRSEIFYQPEHAVPVVQKANALINQNLSSVFH